MTHQIIAHPTAKRRNPDLLGWLAGGAIRPDTQAKPAREDTSEREFRRLHANPRYRARLWL